MRAGVWNEEKILFKNAGHNHRGGAFGTHILGARSFGSGCLQYIGTALASNVAKRKMFVGTLTKNTHGATAASGLCFYDLPGWTGIEFCRINSRTWANATTGRGGGEGTVEFGNCRVTGAGTVRVFISGTVASAATYQVNAFILGY